MNNQKIILGRDIFGDREIVVSDYLRQSGFYVIGKQGVGKSSFLSHLINQDIVKGYPVIVLDPHGDLITDVIYQMPLEAVGRTYLLDLEDTDYPFSVNLFALSGEEAKDIKLRQKGIDRILRVCERLFPGESRMMLERVLRVIVQTLADNQGCSMGDIPALLYDEKYRSHLAKNTSRRARQYWEMDYNTLPPSSRSREVKPLNNRISSLLDNPMLENIVAQKTTSIDFRKSIDNREIILIKLPVQEYSGIAPIIGTILIAEIYRSTFSFRDTQLEDRVGFSLFVDEFQNFSTRDFSELFTQGRKFGCRLLVAHQYREQLTQDNISSTLTAPTIVSFSVTHTNARELSTSFVDQEAVIREPVIYPDVLKHLPEHQSSHVSTFLQTHIEPLQKRAKEPFMALPSYLPQFQTIGDMLRFLEELMYRVQVQGYVLARIGDELEQTVVSKMYYEYQSIGSRILGCSNFLLDMKKLHPKRVELETKAQEKIAELEEQLRVKRQALESDTAFLQLFVSSEGGRCEDGSWSSTKWQKEQTLERRRQRLLSLLQGMLNHTGYDGFKYPIAATALTGRTVEDVRDNIAIIARENAGLSALDTPEKICEIRKWCVSGKLAKMEQKHAEMLRKFSSQIGWRKPTSPITYESGKPGLYNGDNCRECVDHLTNVTYWGRHHHTQSRALDLCHDIVRWEEAIYNLKEDPLQAKAQRGGHFEKSSLEEVASFCQYLSTLDTPQKVFSALKQEYDLLNLTPLRDQLTQAQAQLEADLAYFERQIKAEEPIFKRFQDSLFYCLFDLAASPLCEQKTLTPNDTTHILEHLDARLALVHTGRGENGDCSVFAIKTLDAPCRVDASVFASRMDDIVDRTRKKYCRSRLKVEAQLREREKDLIAVEDDNLGDLDGGGDDLMRFDD